MKAFYTFLILLTPFFVISQEVGDFHQGGIVFYIDSSDHGLIIDTVYLESTFNWVSESPLQSNWGLHWVNNFNAVETFIGAGQFNTQNLIVDSNEHYAANLCFNSNNGGYSDWFLPSKDELWKIMLNISTIDSSISIYGGDSILNNAFTWSSSQSNNSTKAWAASTQSTDGNGLSLGPNLYEWLKSNSGLVRAIRCIDNDCSFDESLVFGCMDVMAENYNPNASANNFTCQYVDGCSDINSCNYDSLVTQNVIEMCNYSCVGCTDSLAINYSGLDIYIDDNSCLYCNEDFKIVSVSFDSLINNSVIIQINDDDFIVVDDTQFNQGFCLPNGCYTLSVFATCDISENWIGNIITIGDFIYELDTVSANFEFFLGGTCETCLNGTIIENDSDDDDICDEDDNSYVCDSLELIDVIVNDSIMDITISFYNYSGIDLTYPFVAYIIDANLDTIHIGEPGDAPFNNFSLDTNWYNYPLINSSSPIFPLDIYFGYFTTISQPFQSDTCYFIFEENTDSNIFPWSCYLDACIEPMDGSGMYGSLEECEANCFEIIEESYNCVSDACIDPQDGTGIYSSLNVCEQECHSVSSIYENNFDVNIFPNPSSNIFNLEFYSYTKSKITVTNVLGEQVYIESIKSIGEFKAQIDLSNYSKGIYNLTIKTSDGISNHKLILQ